MTMKTRAATLGLVAAFLIAGCSGHRGDRATFHDPNMDFGLIQSVAVLPFGNLTISPKAGEMVREVFMTTLQATVDVYVHPPGEVRRAVSRVQPNSPTEPTAEEAVRLAENLGADVVITGTVMEFGQVRSASATANVCTLSLRMIEGQTGSVIWSASATRGGIGASERLLGGGGQPMNIVISQTVEELLDQLFAIE